MVVEFAVGDFLGGLLDGLRYLGIEAVLGHQMGSA
jgi:hypothetical protein